MRQVTATVHAAPVVLTMMCEPIRDGAVLVENGLVVAVGPRRQVITGDLRVREWRGILMPGLVNAHTHLEFGPPFADLASSGLPLSEWLEQLQQRGRAMTDVDRQVSARGSAHLLLKSGTTAVVDVVTRPADLGVAASVGLQGASRTAPIERCWSGANDLEGQGVVGLRTRSQEVLGLGEAPVADYLQTGRPLALGTDSLASCPDLDLLAEARATRDLARRQGVEHPEQDLVRALTLGGAQAVGQDLGRLRAGGRADLAVFDVPTDGDCYADLLEHGPGRCLATVLSGRLVHRR
jgi:cytosine/adenosine deaminase-related metal-dependent hydrolase